MNRNNVTWEPPALVAGSTLQERLKDYEHLSDDQMLEKYGIRLTFEVWEYHNENESSVKNPEYFHD